VSVTGHPIGHPPPAVSSSSARPSSISAKRTFGTGEKGEHPLRSLLATQARILDFLIHGLVNESATPIDPVVMQTTALMVQALGLSIHSILRLTATKDMAIRDAFGIARSVTELAVNVCYIGVGGRPIAERAQRHALQKAYRDLHRTGDIGGTQFEVRASHRPDVQGVPGLAEALAEFTGRRGQELTDWTPLSLSDRIAEVAKLNSRAGTSLSGAVISSYRHASELLHGTFFGVRHFWSGSGQPAKTRDEFFARWEEHFTSIFSAAFFSAQGVIEVFGTLMANEGFSETQKALNERVRAHVEGVNTG
jgi:hypothetical protein